ncbi:MAG: phosphatidate cytidylyltransferase [Acidobacteriota bacterium]
MSQSSSSTVSAGAAIESPRRRDSPLFQRVATGLAVATLALVVIFAVPPDVAFFTWFAIFFWASIEFVAMARRLVPTAPFAALYLAIPLAALAVFAMSRSDAAGVGAATIVMSGAALVTFAVGATLLGRVAAPDALASAGVMTLAVPYFAVPVLCLDQLQRLDPWLTFLFILVVSLGDTMAFFVGRAIGRHKLAPRISPNKTIEGSIGGLLFAIGGAAAWSLWRLGEVVPGLLLVAALTALAAQIGDLVESLFKRGAGIKDSAQTLPGHGGVYDRVDAILLAAPVFLAGVLALGPERLLP